MALVSTVADACDFVKTWLAIKRDRPGPPITLDFAVPDAILTVNQMLGELWSYVPPSS